jgi:hypothetical protein
VPFIALATVLLTWTGVVRAQEEQSSDHDWNNICNQVQSLLVQSCGDLVNSDETSYRARLCEQSDDFQSYSSSIQTGAGGGRVVRLKSNSNTVSLHKNLASTSDRVVSL